MHRTYPALDVCCDRADLMLAMVDDFSPAAVEERDESVRVFFSTAEDRDAARFALAARFRVAPVDVPDEDWARRSQENLQPVTVGRLTIFPNPSSNPSSNPKSLTPNPCSIAIVIEPSMGFGTGHHATTRLCLEALQTIDLTNHNVLDVGTGSGILAIAAAKLGAARALGIDTDPDAVQSARENLEHNRDVNRVAFEIADLSSFDAAAVKRTFAVVDVVTANLTGALLMRSADRLLAVVRPGGAVVASGIQVDERDDVVRAFARGTVAWERVDEEWVGMVVKKA